MKNLRSVRSLAVLVLVCLISLLTGLFSAGTALAAIQCYECHGTAASSDYRPRDAALRDDATGAFVGNHQTHMAAPASPAACVKCHNSQAHTTSHRDGFIHLSSNINASPAGGKYMVGGSQKTHWAQTGSPTLGTCSNINCHFEATTPTWGSAPFTAPADCDKCHGAPPSGGASGVAGSHAKHDQYYPGVSNCQKCHSNNTTFQHATSAGKRALNLGFPAAPNNGTGTYSASLTDYLPSQTNALGTCTNLYCHSNGKKALGNLSTATVPTWGGSLPANCTGCHRADQASGSVMSTGSHSKHVSLSTMNTIACSKCHAATANSNMTIANPANHVNGQVNIKFNSLTTAINGTYAGQATPYAKTPGTAYGQCNNVYCHSTIQSGADGTGAPTYRTPTWGNAGTGACGTCHEHDNGHAFTGSAMSTGSHTKHLTQSYGGLSSVMKCVLCHNIGGKTLVAGQSCDATFCHSAAPANHATGLINVIINPLYGATATYNGSQVPRAGFSTCSNVTCHFNTTTPAWGTASGINCFGCHSWAVLSANGAHAKHIDPSVVPTMYSYTANRTTATAYNFGCSNCHPVADTNHMNGSLMVTLNKNEIGVGTLRTKNNATASGIGIANSGITGTTKQHVFCSAAYCHSNGNATNLIFATTPDWYGGSFTGDRCASCHGNAPNNTIAGSKSHYNTRFLGFTSAAGGHQIGIHAMSNYSGSHGSAATATTISCNICHFETVTSARNDENPVCKTCHVAGNSVGALFGNPAAIADKSKHVNGTVNVAFKPMSILTRTQIRPGSFATAPYSSAWKRNVGYKSPGAYDSAKSALNTATMWDGASKTCSNIACHNGQSVKWTDNNGATTCVSCHTSL